jgi:hypothetical protein
MHEMGVSGTSRSKSRIKTTGSLTVPGISPADKALKERLTGSSAAV